MSVVALGYTTLLSPRNEVVYAALCWCDEPRLTRLLAATPSVMQVGAAAYVIAEQLPHDLPLEDALSDLPRGLPTPFARAIVLAARNAPAADCRAFAYAHRDDDNPWGIITTPPRVIVGADLGLLFSALAAFTLCSEVRVRS